MTFQEPDYSNEYEEYQEYDHADDYTARSGYIPVSYAPIIEQPHNYGYTFTRQRPQDNYITDYAAAYQDDDEYQIEAEYQDNYQYQIEAEYQDNYNYIEPVAASHIRPNPQEWAWYSLGDLAQIARPHEATPIAFDRRLVLTSYISLGVCFLAIFAYLGISGSSFSLDQGGFFLLGGQQIQSVLATVQHFTWLLVGANLLYLLLSGGIMLATRNFQVGRPSLHLAMFGQTLLGAFNILLFSLTLLIIVVNVVIWLIIIAICLSIVYGLFATSRR